MILTTTCGYGSHLHNQDMDNSLLLLCSRPSSKPWQALGRQNIQITTARPYVKLKLDPRSAAISPGSKTTISAAIRAEQPGPNQ